MRAWAQSAVKRLGQPVAVAVTLAAAATALPAAIGAPATAAPARAHVVIALVGESVNVYQRDFAAPGLTANPKTWLPGYPQGATALRLHLNQPDLNKAIAADDKTWRSVKPGRLYYIPGTRFAGVVYLPNALDRCVCSTSDSNDPTGPLQSQPRPIIDGDIFHGTGVASVAAGNRYGTCPDCDIVMVASDNPDDGLAWAAKQPWIDIVSNSWGGPLGIPTQATAGHPERVAQIASLNSRVAAASGQAVLFGSGNGVTDQGPTTHGTQHSLTWDSPYAGPPWVLSVGASKPGTGQPTDWHNIPVDLIAQGESRPAADYQSTAGESDFFGTSCSTPIVAGVLGEALYRARKILGDRQVGPVGGALLTNPRATGGAPRRLDYLQLFADLRAVATWHAFDPSTLAQDPFFTPTTPLAYVYEGYGVVDRDSIGPLTKVLAGALATPARPELTQWEQLNQQVRSQLWGTPPTPGT